MTLAELQKIFPNATEETWHKHPNGKGWVENTANVAETAYVGPKAVVYDYAVVCGNAKVCGSAEVYGGAVVSGDVCVSGNVLQEQSNYWYSLSLAIENERGAHQ